MFVTFFNKISGKSFLYYWANQVDNFRSIIHQKVRISPCEIERVLEGELTRHHIINTPFETWRVFGIIDNTCIKTSRPGDGPENDTEHAQLRVGAHELQRAFYSGYMRAHGLKYQTLLLPNGMLCSVWDHP